MQLAEREHDRKKKLSFCAGKHVKRTCGELGVAEEGVQHAAREHNRESRVSMQMCQHLYFCSSKAHTHTHTHTHTHRNLYLGTVR